MRIAREIDMSTGDWLLDDDGQLLTTTAPTPELYHAIGIPVGEYRPAPDAGSRIPARITGPALLDRAATLTSDARAAIQPLVVQGLVSLDSIDYATEGGRDQLDIQTTDLRVRIPL